MATTFARQIQRAGTTAEWASVNPILAAGEFGVDRTLNRAKLGDGATPWSSLGWTTLSTDEVASMLSAAALIGSATGANDAVMAAVAADPESAFSIEQRATFVSQYANAATKAATAGLLSKLNRGVQDAVILDIGDSTGNEALEHFYLEALDLAARFPAYTVLYRLWNDAGGVYDAAATIQTGTGAQTLTIYNCSVSGKTPQYALGARWATAVAAVPSPDVIFISHSHNTFDPTPNTNGWSAQYGYFLPLTEELAIQHPKAGIVLMSQNPSFTSGRETWQAKKAQILQTIAAQRGYGFIDVHQAFQDTGNPSLYTKVDGIHPTTSADAPAPNGSRLWADVVGAALVYSKDAATLPRQRSSLLDAAASLVPNVNFTEWSSTNPDGWTVTNATVTKDTTTFETGTYAMRITAGATGSALAELTSTLSFGNKNAIAGRPVTVAARVFIPSGSATTPSVVIKGTGGAAQQSRIDGIPDSQGRWQWMVATRTDPGDGGQLTIQLSPRLSGSAAGYVLVDRIRVVEGDLPRDAVAGTPGPAGASGTSVGQADFISTAGADPVVGMLLAAYGGVGVQAANNAHFFKVTPHRDISASILEWQVHTTGGNYDIGIYSLAGSRLWSKGSTVTPGAGAVIETVSPAVGMVAGETYLLAIAFDGTTAMARGATLGSGNVLRFADAACSAFSLATSFPLPSTITPSTGQLNRWQMIAVRSA